MSDRLQQQGMREQSRKRPGHQGPAPSPAPSTGGGTRPARRGRCALDGSHSCRGGRPAPVPSPAASPPQSAPPVSRIGHAGQAHAFPMIFRYLHAPHRTREIAPRGHPVPQLVQVVPPPLLEQACAYRVHARRPVVGPDLLPRLVNQALVNLKRLHLRLGPGPRLLPLAGWPRADPGLHGPFAPAPLQDLHRDHGLSPPLRPALGTLPLAVSAARGPPSRVQQGRIALTTWPPLSGRQVLLFRASACDELTPPLHRAPPGQQAGRSPAEGTPPRRAFVPELLHSPGFDAIVPPIDASAVVHTRSSSRHAPDPLTAGLFLQRSPPRLLTGAACSGLGSPPARRTRRTCLHHWHSTVHSATFYIASLPFQDTQQNGGHRGRVRGGGPPAAWSTIGGRDMGASTAARVPVDRASPADLMQLATDVGPAP